MKFNFTKLDALEAETSTKEDAVYKMFQDWLSWKQDKATVGRLAKAFFLNNEWDTVMIMTTKMQYLTRYFKNKLTYLDLFSTASCIYGMFRDLDH